MPKYFAVNDIFIHAVYRGSWEVSVQEALACGVPVIVSNTVGSFYDLVREKGTGLSFKAGDEKSLADVMKRMFIDKKLGENCIESARQIINKWNYKVSIGNLREAIRSVK